ncbi:hypothetical protein HDU67_009584 [Dinochytrium kinnereticum]|nr:hypothetical protein HDU67_009584 [Dinochytrium kinnereticum]
MASADTLTAASTQSLESPEGATAARKSRKMLSLKGWRREHRIELPSITCLPIEILERIFILASNPTLALANREFLLLSSSPLVKSRWIIHRYGANEALARCWRWKFMDCTLSDVELKAGLKPARAQKKALLSYLKRRCCSCHRDAMVANSLTKDSQTNSGDPVQAETPPVRKNLFQRWWHLGSMISAEMTEKPISTFPSNKLDRKTIKKNPWLKSPCDIERSQCFLVANLLELGAFVEGGGNMALRVAARRGHLHLVEMLLQNGADPDARVPLPSNAIVRWMRHANRVGGGVIIAQPSQLPSIPPTSSAINEPIENVITVHTFLQAHLPNGVPAQDAGEVGQGTFWNTQNQPLHPLVQGRFGRPGDFKISLLMQAVYANHLPLARVLIRPHKINLGGTRLQVASNAQWPVGAPLMNPALAGKTLVARISKRTLQTALREAFRASRLEMCRLLIEEGGAIATHDMVHELVSRASTWRLTCLREKLADYLVLAIKNMTPEDFLHSSASLTRSSAEIGSPRIVQACIERGADVNVWEGLPLYASVYNGNLEVTKYLLGNGGADTNLFGWRQKGFCMGLILIEGFAIGMFSLLVGLWGVGMFQLIQSWVIRGRGSPALSVNSYADGVTVGELTAMAVPSAVALAVMYRLVPFHSMCIAFVLVCREDQRRRIQTRQSSSP